MDPTDNESDLSQYSKILSTQIDYMTTGKFDLPILMKNEVDDRRNWRLVMTKGRPQKSILLDL